MRTRPADASDLDSGARGTAVPRFVFHTDLQNAEYSEQQSKKLPEVHGPLVFVAGPVRLKQLVLGGIPCPGL
jgi:hypothetical protein